MRRSNRSVSRGQEAFEITTALRGMSALMAWTALHQLPQPIVRLTREESHGTGYDDRTGHR